MQLNQLQRKTKAKGSKRVGRGRASGKGKTSGRGTKGQKARAGHKMWPQIRETLKKLPKRRGYRFTSIEEKPHVISLSTLESFFAAGDTVSVAVLRERGIVKGSRAVKVLGDGELTKKLTISGLKVSKSAKEKIEKVGGSVASTEKAK